MVCGLQSATSPDKNLIPQYLISLIRKNLNLINLKFSLFWGGDNGKKQLRKLSQKKDYYRNYNKLGRDLIKRENDRLKSLLKEKNKLTGRGA